LLTHTSGLPDMLPNNAALRTRHASPVAFFREVCGTPLLFAPGAEVRYQCMGFLVLDRIIEKLSGKPLPDFLRDEFFEPLGMTRTWLGADKAGLTNHASIRISEEARQTDWHWNSAYWLGFGAAWGGLITTASDYARFLAMMLGGGTWRGVRVLSPASVAAATRNQLPSIHGLGETWVSRYPWGLGWRLAWPGRSTFFGDLLSPSSFGHWGSTGTLAWVDPERDACAVILTSLPQDPHGRFLALASNLLASCFE
jgi:CubicO group peptidase (beta-lactamase class C family)